MENKGEIWELVVGSGKTWALSLWVVFLGNEKIWVGLTKVIVIDNEYKLELIEKKNY